MLLCIPHVFTSLIINILLHTFVLMCKSFLHMLAIDSHRIIRSFINVLHTLKYFPHLNYEINTQLKEDWCGLLSYVQNFHTRV